MACDLNKVKANIDHIIYTTITGRAKSITKEGDNSFVIDYGPTYRVKSREQAYNMAQQKIDKVNKELNLKGYNTSVFGPFVSLDQSYSDRFVITRNSYDKLLKAYALRNKAEEDSKEISEILAEDLLNDAIKRAESEREQDLLENIVYATAEDVMPFDYAQEDIVNQKKSFTIRPREYSNQTVWLDKKPYNVKKLPTFSLKDTLQYLNMSLEEFKSKFLGSSNTIKYDHIQDWFDGKNEMYIYEIEEDLNFKAEDINIADDKYIKKINTLENQVSELTKRRVGASEERKVIINANIKRLRDQIKKFQNPNNRVIEQLIKTLEADLENYKELLNNADASYKEFQFIKDSIAGWKTLLSEFDINKEDFPKEYTIKNNVLDEFEILAKDLLAKDNEAANNLLLREKLTPILTEGGSLQVVKDISTTALTLRTLIDNANQLISYIGKKFKMIDALIKKHLHEFTIDFKDVSNNLKKFQKDAGLNVDNYYDFMLSTDEKGKRDGTFVEKESKEYKNLKYEASLLSNAHYWNLIAKNESFELNEDVWEELKAKQKERKYISPGTRAYYTTGKGSAKGATFKTSEELEDFMAEEQFNQWVKSNNPTEFLNILEKLKNNQALTEKETLFLDNYTSEANKKYSYQFWSRNLNKTLYERDITNSNYINNKWQKIQDLSDQDPRKVFYKYFTKTIYKSREDLGNSNIHLPYNFIPAAYPVERQDNESLWDYYKRRIHDTAINQISESLKDNIHGKDINGEEIKYIPLHALTPIDPDKKSYNLTHVLENYITDYYNYKFKSEVEDEFLLLQNVVKHQKVFAETSKGEPVYINGEPQVKAETSNNYLQLQYSLNSFLYGLNQKTEGVLNKDKMFYSFFDNRDLEHAKKRNEELNLTQENKESLLKVFIQDMSPKKEAENEILFKALSPDEQEYLNNIKIIQKIEKRGKSITTKKAANSLIAFTALKQLGLNVMGGVYESVQGLTALTTEAASGKFFTDKESGWALKTWFASLNPNNKTLKTKLNALQGYFDIAGEVTQDLQNKDLIKYGYAQYKAAKLLVNSTFLLAYLKGKKIEGTNKSAFDLFEFDNKGKIKFNSELDENLFTTMYAEYKELLKQNRDRENSTDPIKANEVAIGRLIGQFKFSWIVEGFTKRFGKEESNILIGKRKGIYRSTGNLFLSNKEELDNYGNVILKPRIDLIGGFLRLAVMTKLGSFVRPENVKDMDLFKNVDLSELDLENIKRSMREMTLIMVSFTAMMALKALHDKDDDESALAKTGNLLFNTMMRSNRDLTTYLSPDSFQSIIKNIIPAIETASAATKIGSALVDTLLLDPYSNPGTPNEYLKLPRRIEEFIPIVNQARKLINKVEKQQKLTNNY